jgi:hypothetical protein
MPSEEQFRCSRFHIAAAYTTASVSFLLPFSPNHLFLLLFSESVREKWKDKEEKVYRRWGFECDFWEKNSYREFSSRNLAWREVETLIENFPSLFYFYNNNNCKLFTNGWIIGNHLKIMATPFSSIFPMTKLCHVAYIG